MSAWIVDREHIDVLIVAGLRGPRGQAVSPDSAWHALRWFDAEPDVRNGLDWYQEHRRELTAMSADDVGRMLWLENVASVAHRYPNDGPNDRPGPRDFCDADAEIYSYRDPGYRPSAGEILQTIGCYVYQSCEHPGWRSSEARQFCDALQDAVCATLYEGPWGWDAETLAKARGEVLIRG